MVRLLQAAEGVDDVHRRMPAMLDTTDPKELKAILAHSIERIEAAGAQASLCCTFAQPKDGNYASQWRPRGASGSNVQYAIYAVCDDLDDTLADTLRGLEGSSNESTPAVGLS